MTALQDAVLARDSAQKQVEEAVAVVFPIGRPVTFDVIGKPFQGFVTGTEGEIVLIKHGEKITRRHFDKVTKA